MKKVTIKAIFRISMALFTIALFTVLAVAAGALRSGTDERMRQAVMAYAGQLTSRAEERLAAIAEDIQKLAETMSVKTAMDDLDTDAEIGPYDYMLGSYDLDTTFAGVYNVGDGVLAVIMASGEGRDSMYTTMIMPDGLTEKGRLRFYELPTDISDIVAACGPLSEEVGGFKVINSSEGPRLTANHPVYSSKLENIFAGEYTKYTGSVIAIFEIDKLTELVGDGDDLYSATVLLADGDGRVVAGSDGVSGGMELSDCAGRYGMFESFPVRGGELTIAVGVPEEALFPHGRMFMLVFAALAVMVALLIIMLARSITTRVIKPVGAVTTGVGSVARDRTLRLEPTGSRDMDAVVDAVNGMLDALARGEWERWMQQQSLYISEMEKQSMVTYLLKKQIDGHFIVNTLTNIDTLVRAGRGEEAGEMARGLSAMITHYHNNGDFVNVFTDLEIIERYVRIMNIRYSGAYEADYDVDDRLVDYEIPVFILQPLVENALTHGLRFKEGDCRLSISGRLIGERILFTVADNGTGIAADRLRAIVGEISGKAPLVYRDDGLEGVALKNIQRRIELLCGSGYGIDVESTEGEGTTVYVWLPARREHDGRGD